MHSLLITHMFICLVELHEYCEWESFNGTCLSDEVIIMRTARYGRMRLGRCVNQNYGHIGCGTDVMPFLETKCSGQQACVVSVISFHDKRSCPKDFKGYLEASYYCLKGMFTIYSFFNNDNIYYQLIKLSTKSTYGNAKNHE